MQNCEIFKINETQTEEVMVIKNKNNYFYGIYIDTMFRKCSYYANYGYYYIVRVSLSLSMCLCALLASDKKNE